MLIGGCSPPTDGAGSVVAVFGGVGLGPGAFSYPRAIATSATGSVFIVDKSGRIQRFSENGAFETAWRMPEIQQGKPVGITVHPDGRIFVADTHYHRVMVFGPEGKRLASFGREGTGDGSFLLPTAVVIDADGFIYVSEYGGNDRITRWSADLTFDRVVVDGEIEGRPLRRPADMVIDDEQTIWVADACNHRIVQLSRDGETLLTFGGRGRKPGELRYPYSIDIGGDGSILVCEYGGDRLQRFSRSGEFIASWGRSGRGVGELSGPWGAVYGAGHRVYVVDSMNSRIQIIKL